MKNSILQPKNEGIYILTNTVNNKQYVGMDSNMPRRFKQHIKGIARCPLLHDALSAFGLDKWTVQFIPYPSISNTALRAVEQWYIGKLNTKHPDSYNMREGSNPILKQKRANHLTPVAKRRVELKAQARARRKEGATFKIISEELGKSQTNIRRWCRSITVEKETVRGTASRKRAEKAARKQQARTRRKEGAKIETIATEFGISISTASEWCKGIKPDG